METSHVLQRMGSTQNNSFSRFLRFIFFIENKGVPSPITVRISKVHDSHELPRDVFPQTSLRIFY